MKFYAVRLPIRAIFTSWAECKAVVSEARFNKYKSFFSLEEARAFMEEGLVLQEQADGHGEEERKDEDGGGDEDDNRGRVKQESACAGVGGGEGGGGGGAGGGRRMGASSSVLTTGLKEEGEMGARGRDARKRKASVSEADGKKCEEGGGGGGEVISLLSDSGEEDQDKGLRGGQKKRLKSDQAHAEDVRDEEEDRNSEEDDDDGDERFQATQTIPASPLFAAAAAPPSLSHPSTAAATAAGAGGAAGLAGDAARVITSGTLFFDGGSRGNPGIAGCGAVMYDDTTGAKVWSLSAYLGHNKTNNQAEYAALCFGLEEALKRGVTSIQAFGDSTLVVKQVEGAWKVKNAGMKIWHAKALALKKKFKRFRIGFVPREENGVADALANEGMDEQREGGPVVVEEG